MGQICNPESQASGCWARQVLASGLKRAHPKLRLLAAGLRPSVVRDHLTPGRNKHSAVFAPTLDHRFVATMRFPKRHSSSQCFISESALPHPSVGGLMSHEIATMLLRNPSSPPPIAQKSRMLVCEKLRQNFTTLPVYLSSVVACTGSSPVPPFLNTNDSIDCK